MSKQHKLVRTGTGPSDFRLDLLKPIQTRDSNGNRIISIRTTDVSNPVHRGTRTIDDILTGPEPVTRISLGRVWTGNDGDPLVKEANYATKAFAEGCFAPDQVLHAETLENVISLGRTWIGNMEVLLAKARVAESLSHDNAADDPRPHEAGSMFQSTDARNPAIPRNRAIGFGKPVSAAQYQDGLRKGREAMATDQDRTLGAAPKAALSSAEYAANLAKHRAAKAAG